MRQWKIVSFPNYYMYICASHAFSEMMTNIRVDQYFFDRPTSVLQVLKKKKIGKKRERERGKWIFLFFLSSSCNDDDDDDQDHRSLLSL